MPREEDSSARHLTKGKERHSQYKYTNSERAVYYKKNNDVVVGAWKDKRLVTFLSTKDAEEIVSANKKNCNGEEVIKPGIIVKYNHCKQGIDLSVQLCSYFSPLRKTVR